ncbi:hypothetical protein [Leptospira yasudae]|uniref:YcxB-like protein domain-containing protein n=1 Tax=Leptospira yasudae TaxID=2202201 RepID=A0A6N4QVK9_9LEPT|nr:hypothetical protein [Leptospira yasudae]TGL75216.1 hypothetical protein EHQ72_17115 [Leptospira yasudae]TGL77808.1 hypothetical protein EHQ77_14490 [Leptospira yasudae]TGL81214.1 hypothetical protein EHQ83_15265 [Leptospira yasudae]
MEFTYSLTKQQQKKNYLFGYYNRPILWFQRRFTGPLLLLIAALEYGLLEDSTYRLSFAFFFGFLGFYHILRPYLFLKRIRFEDLQGTVQIDSNGLSIVDEKGELRLQPKDVLKIIPKKHYVFLKARVYSVVYFLLDRYGFDSKENADRFLTELDRFLKNAETKEK